MTPDPDLPTTVDAWGVIAIADAATSWMASDPCDGIVKAFVKALWEMEDVPKTRRVEAGPMRYKYADLSDVLEEIRPKLKMHGLALSQTATEHGVATSLFHESGQWIRFAPLLIRPVGGTPQNVGSAITYARRYSAQTVMGLATEDDDGHAAAVAATGPAAEDPKAIRVDAVLARLRELTDEQKTEMRTWATTEERSLSGKALYEDPDWLTMVEAYVDVLVTDDPAEDARTDESPY